MKKLLTTTVCLLGTVLLFAQAKPTEVKSTIEEVRVYTQGAQIQRTAEVFLPEGETSIRLKGLSGYLDPASLRVSVPDPFLLISASHQFDFLGLDTLEAGIQELMDREEQLSDSIKLLNNERSVLEEEAEMLRSNRKIGGTQNGVPVDQLQAMSRFYGQRMQAIHREQFTLDQRLKDLRKTKQRIQQQIAARNQENPERTGEFLLKLRAEAPGTCLFSFTYLTQGASWFPDYDLRVRNVADPVQLTYKAKVQQRTGEDWDKVTLILSNAQPDQENTVPVIAPYYLSSNMRYATKDVYSRTYAEYDPSVRKIRGTVTDDTGERLIGASVLMKGTSAGTVTDIDGTYEMNVPEGVRSIEISYTGYNTIEIPISDNTLNASLETNTELSEVVVTAYSSERKGLLQGRVAGVTVTGQSSLSKSVPTTVVEYSTSIEFEVDDPYTIPSNGETYTIAIHQLELPAEYLYTTLPLAEERAYLQASITDWEQYQLLTGEANLFFEQAYIGRSLLDTRYVRDTLRLDLGIDRGVSVQREEIQDFSRSSLFGGKRTTTKAWRITLRNNKEEAVAMTIEDQVPVSQEKDINVDIQEISGGQLDAETGLVTWQKDLAPKETVTLVIRYQIRAPAEYDLIIR